MEENVLDDFIEEVDERPEVLTDSQIFSLIWTSPKQVFRFLDSYQYEKHTTVLLVLAGISRAFDRASMQDMGDKMGITSLVITCIVAGALFGWISYYIYAAAVSWTGSWLGGKGDTKRLLRVMAYAMIPAIVALFFLIPQIAVYGEAMFQSNGDITSASIAENILVYGSLLIEFSLALWAFVLTVIAVSVVQELSIGKSIVNLLLPVIVLVVPILLIALLVGTF